MKKNAILLILSTLILWGGNLYSQRLTLGVKAGLGSTGLLGGISSNPLFDSNSFKLGGEFGVYGQYHISNTFSFSLGLEYSMMGGVNKFKSFTSTNESFNKVNSPDTIYYSNFKSDMNIDYMSIPILARKSWKINKKMNIYAGIGPVISFLINAHRSITSDSIYTDIKKKNPSIYKSLDGMVDSQPLNELNIGVNGLLGLSYNLNKKEAVFIEIGATYALHPIQYDSLKGLNGYSYPFTEMITIGYAFTPKEHYKNRYQRRFRNY